MRLIARFWIWFFFERVEIRHVLLFAYGAGVNFLPYYLPGWVAGRVSRRQTDYATTRLLASVLAFPLFWALETSVVGWTAGFCGALAFFLSVPLGGLIAYRYLVGTGGLRHQLRFGALLLTHAQEARRLLAESRAIIDELERAKRDHVEGAAGGATAQGSPPRIGHARGPPNSVAKFLPVRTSTSLFSVEEPAFALANKLKAAMAPGTIALAATPGDHHGWAAA